MCIGYMLPIPFAPIGAYPLRPYAHTLFTQRCIKFEQQIVMLVTDFNLQPKVIKSAKKASDIAKESYDLMLKRFKLGEIDIVRLNAANAALQSAQQAYILSLQNYWDYYYQLQNYTQYDFIHQEVIQEDIDQLLQAVE